MHLTKKKKKEDTLHIQKYSKVLKMSSKCYSKHYKSS